MGFSGARHAGLRADAARNRQAIVEAARELYRQRGLGVPLDEIARRAGVGNATLYRHFPSRWALAAAVFTGTLRRVGQAATEAMDEPDPWRGFARHVLLLCRLQAADRGLADLFTTEIAGAPELERQRARAHRAFVRLAVRARGSGQLRADFTPGDLVLLLMANRGLAGRTAGAAPAAWERFAGLILDGLRSTAAAPAARPLRRAAARPAMSKRGHALGYRLSPRIEPIVPGAPGERKEPMVIEITRPTRCRDTR